MAQEDVRLSGTFLDSAGNAIANKTVTLFSEGTITNPLDTDTTDSSGEWDFTRVLSDLPGRYDVQLVNGTQTYRILSRDKFQVTELQARNPTTAHSALSAYSTTSEAASLVATFGFRPATESSGVETPDTPSDGDLGYVDFTLSNDHSDKQEWITARIAWEGSDVSDGSEDGQFNFWTMTAGTLVEELHLNGAALWPETDAGLDLGTSALGFNDLHLGSGGVINFDGSDVTLTHSSNTLTVAGGTFATAALTATTIVGATSLQVGSGATVTTIDNADLATGSATKLATQGAIKSYVDARIATEDTIAELNDTNIGSLAAGHILVYDNTASVWDNVALSGGTGLTATLGDGTLALAIDSTVATLTGSQILTSKTLTAPAINGVVGGTQTSATITALTLTSMAQNWTNASRTVADMGTVTTIDINGGTIDGTTVGATGHSTIKGTTIDATDDFTIGSTVITDGVITDSTGLSLAANVTVTGNLTVSGTTTTVDTTNTVITDNLLELNSGAGSNTNDSGIIIERGSTGNNAIFMWDESEDVFTVGTTTATASSTGNLANFAAAGFTAAAITGTSFTTTGTVATGALTVTGDEIVANGYGLIVGHTSQIQISGTGIPEFQVLGTGASDSRMIVGRFSNDNDSPVLVFGKGKGSIANNSTAVAADSILGDIYWNGADGTDMQTLSALLRTRVPSGGTVSTGVVESEMLIYTSTSGGSLTEALRIDSSQNTSIPLGSKFAFDSGVGDTYIYQESDDDLHVVVGGTSALQIDQHLLGMSYGYNASISSSTAHIFKTTYGDVAGSSGGGMAVTHVFHEATGSTSATHHGYAATVQMGSANTENWTATVGLRAYQSFVQVLDTDSNNTVAGVASYYVRNATSSGAIITNQYGIYIENLTSAVNDYGLYIAGADTAAIYVASGDVIIGAANGQLKATHNLALYADFGNVQDDSEIRFNVDNSQVGFVGAGGLMMLGDTANANMTVGLTINQGANVDEILAFKTSADTFAHGVTTLAETDTYASFRQVSSVSAGLEVNGFSQATVALELNAIYTSDTAVRTTSALAPIKLDTKLASGDSVTDPAADKNLAVIRANGTTRYIFDSDGSAHADVEWVAYAKHDDLALINEIEYELLGVEGAGQTARRHFLEGAGIIGQDSWHFENGKQRAMVNFSKLSMLHHGALMQMGEKHMSLAEKVDGLEVQLIEAKKQLAAISA